MKLRTPDDKSVTDASSAQSPKGIDEQSSGHDHIQVGSIYGRAAVAIGRGANAHVRVFNVDIRLLPLVVVLVAIVIALSAAIYTLTKKPQAMVGEFNVAVAEFAVADENNKITQGQDGLRLAGWLYRRLDAELQDLEVNHYELWPPAYTGAIRGGSPEERARSAEQLAQKINANVIVSGVIAESDHPQVTLEFYVNNRGFEVADELVGRHYLGNPILVELPFEPERYQGISNHALTARVKALSEITIGLSLYAMDDFKGAIEHFEQAEGNEGWLRNAGKEVVYLLLANAYARWASKEKTLAHLDEANFYLDRAQAIKNPYPRAAVTRASILYLQALGDPTSNTVDDGLLQESELRYKEALALSDDPSVANLEYKVRFGLGQIKLVKHVLEEGDWLGEAEVDFKQLISEYEDGNDRLQDLAGHSYARLGYIEQLRGHTAEAVALYEQGVDLVSPFYQIQYLVAAGELHGDMCQMESALERYDLAAKIGESIGDEESVEWALSRRQNMLDSQKCQ